MKSYCDVHKEVEVPLGAICPECHMDAHKEIEKLKEMIGGVKVKPLLYAGMYWMPLGDYEELKLQLVYNKAVVEYIKNLGLPMQYPHLILKEAKKWASTQVECPDLNYKALWEKSQAELKKAIEYVITYADDVIGELTEESLRASIEKEVRDDAK